MLGQFQVRTVPEKLLQLMSCSVYGVTNSTSTLVTPFQKFAYSMNRGGGKKL